MSFVASKFHTLRPVLKLWFVAEAQYVDIEVSDVKYHSALIRNLIKLKGKAKPTLQYHFMTPRES